jgi:hypothetical protein
MKEPIQIDSNSVPGWFVVLVGKKRETVKSLSLGDLRDRFGFREIMFDGQLRYNRFSLTPINS